MKLQNRFLTNGWMHGWMDNPKPISSCNLFIVGGIINKRTTNFICFLKFNLLNLALVVWVFQQWITFPSAWDSMSKSTPYATSFRRRFLAYHHAMEHLQTNIILSLFRIPLVLKCAAKSLKIGLQIKI